MTPLVSTDWLAENLNTPGLLVMDASFYMPAEKIDPHAVFGAGHIPGAQFFDIETIADIETDLPHMVPSVGRFERLFAGARDFQFQPDRFLRPEGHFFGTARMVDDAAVRA